MSDPWRSFKAAPLPPLKSLREMELEKALAQSERMLERLAFEYEHAAAEFTIDWEYDSWRESPRKDIQEAVDRAEKHLADLRARAEEAADG
jgi:hypothetical protein